MRNAYASHAGISSRAEGDPKGDIGSEMQKLRGYGKARQSKQWRVR